MGKWEVAAPYRDRRKKLEGGQKRRKDQNSSITDKINAASGKEKKKDPTGLVVSAYVEKKK